MIRRVSRKPCMASKAAQWEEIMMAAGNCLFVMRVLRESIPLYRARAGADLKGGAGDQVSAYSEYRDDQLDVFDQPRPH
jgi:hypothetical protein